MKGVTGSTRSTTDLKDIETSKGAPKDLRSPDHKLPKHHPLSDLTGVKHRPTQQEFKPPKIHTHPPSTDHRVTKDLSGPKDSHSPRPGFPVDLTVIP